MYQIFSATYEVFSPTYEIFSAPQGSFILIRKLTCCLPLARTGLTACLRKPNCSKINIPQVLECGNSHGHSPGQASLSQLQVLGLFPESRPVCRRDAPSLKGGRNNSPYRHGSFSALFGQRSGCWELHALAPVYLEGPGRDCKEINKDIKFRKLFNKAAFPTRCPGNGMSPTPCLAPEGKW